MKNNAIQSNNPKIGCLSIILLFLAVSQVFSQTELTLKDLVVNSSDIAIVQVKSKTSHWDTDRTRIYSEVDLEVIEKIQGELKKGDTFKIFHIGGSIDGITTAVLEMPSLVEGRQSVLFLNKRQSDTYGDHYTIHGMNQGAYDISTTDRGIQNITRHNMNRSLRLEKNGPLLSLSDTNAMSIQEFLSYIRLYSH